MTPIAPAEPALKPEQILAMFKPAVEQILREHVTQDIEPDRLYQLRQAEKADLYWRGLQYRVPRMGEGGLVEYSAVGSPISSTPDDASGVYDYVQNIYRGYGRKLIALLGQKAPPVAGVPDNPEDEESIKHARLANVAAQILGSKWDADTKNLELAAYLWKHSTSFLYTPYVTDGEKYGCSEEPKLEVRQVPSGAASFRCINCGTETPEDKIQPEACQCPQCGNQLGPEDRQEPEAMEVPEVAGVQRYENGCVELHITNILTTSVPFFTKTLNDALHLTYEYDESKFRLLKDYPELRDQKDLDGTGDADSASSSIGSLVRETAQSPIGIPSKRPGRWSFARRWLKTPMYEAVEDKALREGLYKQFPDGLKVTVIQGKVVRLENEKLTDVWVECKPETSEYIYADALGADLMPAQDFKNDSLNLAMETLERGIGLTFADPRVVDVQAWSERQALPAEIVPVLRATGDRLEDSFFQTQPARFSDQLMPFEQHVEADAKAAVGTTEALYGGYVPGDQKTAHEAELRKNASRLQHETTRANMRRAWEKAYANAVRQLAKYGAGKLEGSRKTKDGYESLVVDIAELKADGWHFEGEEGIPMSPGEQRDLLTWFMEKPPEIQQRYGLLHPRNIDRNTNLLGLSTYYIPGTDTHDKACETIRELLKGKPIQQPDPTGQIQLQPSIEIDDWDDHGAMADEARAWLVSSIGRRTKQDNPDGFMNVVAWLNAHNAAANPPQAQPPAPPPRLSVSLPLDKVDPQTRTTVLGDLGVQLPQAGPAPAGPPQPEPISPQAPTEPQGPPSPPPGEASAPGEPMPLAA